MSHFRDKLHYFEGVKVHKITLSLTQFNFSTLICGGSSGSELSFYGGEAETGTERRLQPARCSDLETTSWEHYRAINTFPQ